MIILYGGSFNPPTIAHYRISQYLINKYQPKAFIFIPVGNDYDKSELIDFKHRYNMVNLLANKLKNTLVSDIENKQPFKGTIETLKYFQSMYPNDPLYYVIGADNLLSLDEWIDYEILLKKCKFIVLNRKQINSKQLIEKNKNINKYKSSFVIEDGFNPIDISSTQYRESKADKVVMKSVNDYIYHYQLYDRGDKE